MKCPNCECDLVESKEAKFYQTNVEHVCDPNGESCPRTFFYCVNDSCDLYYPHTKIFWGHDGDYYSTLNKIGTSWFRENERNLQNPKTFKRKGTPALGSTSRKIEDEMIAERRYWWQRLRTKLRYKYVRWKHRVLEQIR